MVGLLIYYIGEESLKRTGATKNKVLKREKVVDFIAGSCSIVLFVGVSGYALAGFLLGY
jgi:hypothetical protein